MTMHAIYTDKKDCEAYQAKCDAKVGRPKLVGQPGGDDPTGRRHLYARQTLEIHGHDIVEANDKSEWAHPLVEGVEPGPKAKVAKLEEAKWKVAEPEKAKGP